MSQPQTIVDRLHVELIALKTEASELRDRLKRTRQKIHRVNTAIQGNWHLIRRMRSADSNPDFDLTIQEVKEVLDGKSREEAMKDARTFREIWGRFGSLRVGNALLRGGVKTFQEMSTLMEDPPQWYAIRNVGPAATAEAHTVLCLLEDALITSTP